MSALAWYAIFSKPRHEQQVADYLRSKDLEVFHPTYHVKPVNPRASTTRSFFPRYLFVQADLNDCGTSVLQWVPGAVGLVEFDGEPATIPDTFMHDLHRRVDAINAGGGLELDGLKKGDPVRIAHGPFAGYEAIFDLRLSGEERVQVLMKWLGREIKVKVENSALEKIRRPRAG